MLRLGNINLALCSAGPLQFGPTNDDMMIMMMMLMMTSLLRSRSTEISFAVATRASNVLPVNRAIL